LKPELVRRLEDPHELLSTPRLAAVLEEGAPDERRLRVPLQRIDAAAEILLERRGRLVGLFLAAQPEVSLAVVIAFRGDLVVLRAPLDGADEYPSLARFSPAARLLERELHDVEGIRPVGYPDLQPVLHPNADKLPVEAVGEGLFTIPYGPIRSGVFESIQYVIDTGGEDILGLALRPFFKRRDLERRFVGLGYEHGAILAERVAGIASVAHALAYAQAVERALSVEPPRWAQRWRVVHAELERIANHLDVATKLAEDAALSVGVARFGILKEQIMRLRAQLCGSRFGRGVILPGGISGPPLIDPATALAKLDRFEKDLARDRHLLLTTTSFTDRLIGSGRLDAAVVDAYGGVGPVARGSGIGTDARFERPYSAYVRLGSRIVTDQDGDAFARLRVRFGEITESLHIIRQAFERLDKYEPTVVVEMPPGAGSALGWAEAPMGEVVYSVEVSDGQLQRVRICSPSLRNWPLFVESFRGDVLTDFSFIEHSFGLTQAGADR
jgi:formate hydrogenlyase subunit 5